MDFGSVGWRSLGESAANNAVARANKTDRVAKAARLPLLFLGMKYLLQSLLPSYSIARGRTLSGVVAMCPHGYIMPPRFYILNDLVAVRCGSGACGRIRRAGRESITITQC